MAKTLAEIDAEVFGTDGAATSEAAPSSLDGLDLTDAEREFFGIKPERSEFGAGLSAGIDQTQGLGYGAAGLVGDLVGSETLSEWGREGYQRNMAEAAENAPAVRFTEIGDLGDAGTWAAYTFGNLIPTMATLAATGGAGGMVGKYAVRKGVESALKRGAAGQAARLSGQGVKWGAGAGAGLGSTALEGGGIHQEIIDETGQTRPGVALGFGALAGSFDAIPIVSLLHRMGVGKKAVSDIASDMVKQGLVKKVATEAGIQAVFEGSTEALQEVINKSALKWVESHRDIFTEEHINEFIDAAAAGGLMGLTMGGAGGAVGHYRAPRPPDEETPPETEPESALNDASRYRERIEATEERIRIEDDPNRPGPGGIHLASPEVEEIDLSGGVYDEEIEMSGPAMDPDQQLFREETNVLRKRIREKMDALRRPDFPLGTETGEMDLAPEEAIDLSGPAPQETPVPEWAPTTDVAGQRPEAEPITGVPDPGPSMDIGVEYVDELDQAAHQAIESPRTGPEGATDAQVRADNYKKGRWKEHGLKIAIENPAGSTRRSRDPDNPWESEVKFHYGHILGTRGADGEPIDVFLGPLAGTDVDYQAYVINQKKEDGTPDEEKIMLGHPSQEAAEAAYLSNYPDNWLSVQGGDLGTETYTIDELKSQLKALTQMRRSEEQGERARQRQGLDVTKDSMGAAVAKLGGLDGRTLGGEVDEGLRFKYDKRGRRQPVTAPGTFLPIVRAEGGLAPDRMAEKLYEMGYPVVNAEGGYDPNVMYEALNREAHGDKVYSSFWDQNELEQEAEDRGMSKPADPLDEEFSRTIDESWDEAMANIEAESAQQDEAPDQPLTPEQEEARRLIPIALEIDRDAAIAAVNMGSTADALQALRAITDERNQVPEGSETVRAEAPREATRSPEEGEAFELTQQQSEPRSREQPRVEAQGDLLAPPTTAERVRQQQEDRRREQESSPDVTEGEGGLFAQRGQTDLTDKSPTDARQSEKVSPETSPDSAEETDTSETYPQDRERQDLRLDGGAVAQPEALAEGRVTDSREVTAATRREFWEKISRNARAEGLNQVYDDRDGTTTVRLSKVSEELYQEILSALERLVLMGMPIEVAKLPSMFAMVRGTKPNVGGAMYAGFDTRTGEFTVSTVAVTDHVLGLSAGGSEKSRADLYETLAHEIGHVMDKAHGSSLYVEPEHLRGAGYTQSSARFVLPTDAVTWSEVEEVDVDTRVTGDIMSELLDAWMKNRGGLQRKLNYPFGHLDFFPALSEAEREEKLNMIQQEAWAQAVSLFYTHPKRLREAAPKTYDLVKEVNDAYTENTGRERHARIRSAFQSDARFTVDARIQQARNDQALESRAEEGRARPGTARPRRSAQAGATARQESRTDPGEVTAPNLGMAGIPSLVDTAKRYDDFDTFFRESAGKGRKRREYLRAWKAAQGIEPVSSDIDRGDGIHSPANPESGAPLYDVADEIYPEDVYSIDGLRYYGTGEESMDPQAWSILMDAEGNPNKRLKVYRAVEKDAGPIQPGDWVTTVRRYATDHGRSNMNNEYRIASKTVSAKDLYTDGNSWLEWGYHPQTDLYPSGSMIKTAHRRAWEAAQGEAGATEDTATQPTTPASSQRTARRSGTDERFAVSSFTGTGLTPDKARKALEKRLGKKAVAKGIDSGRLVLVANEAELRAHIGPYRDPGPGKVVRGLVHPDTGVAYLVTNNMTEGMAYATLIHEIGAHGMPNITGRAFYNKLMKRLQALAENPSSAEGRVLVDAMNRVPEGTPESQYWDEVLAYLVENPNNQKYPATLKGLIDAVIAKVRGFLARNGWLDPKNLSTKDIVELAKSSLRADLRRLGQIPIVLGVDANEPAVLRSEGPADRYTLDMYSQLTRAARGLKQDKAPPDQMLKMLKKQPGVKDEEIEWTGLNDWLEAQEGSVTKDQVVAFLEGNGVQLQEVVADQAQTEETFDWDEQVIDDPAEWEHRVEDYLSEFDDGDRDFFFFDEGKWYDDNIEAVIDNYKSTLPADEAAELEAAGDINEVREIVERAGFDVDADMAQTMREDFEEAAREAAEREYMENPYRRWYDPNTEIEIIGNDDIGYSVRGLPGTRANTDFLGSFGEAEIQALDAARDYGLLASETDWYTAQWEDHVVGGYKSYAEHKLILESPQPDGDFEYDEHFPDPNIIAFQRVTHRDIGNFLNVYAIDEFQSDWHQQGMKHGYEGEGRSISELTTDRDTARLKSEEMLEKLANDIRGEVGNPPRPDNDRLIDQHEVRTQEAMRAYFTNLEKDDPYWWAVAYMKKNVAGVGETTSGEALARNYIDAILARKEQAEAWWEQDARVREVEAERGSAMQRVPNAPFKGNAWLSLGLKRALLNAARNGADHFAWADENMLVDRWGDRYRSFYRNQYNEKMPSIVKKLTGLKPQRVTTGGMSFRADETLEEFQERFQIEETHPGDHAPFSVIGPSGSVLSRNITRKEAEEAAFRMADQLHFEKSKEEGWWMIPLDEATREEILQRSYPLFAKNTDPWYSQMQRTLQTKLPGRGTPASMMAQIDGLAKKGEFKKEELEWSGVREWLSEQEGKVTREEVLAFLAENQIRVDEVMGSQETGDLPAATGREGITTQQLPGGENYRELLLTLPQKKSSSYIDVAKEMGFNVRTMADVHRLSDQDKAAVSKEATRRSEQSPAYFGGHYDEPNVLAHVRFNDRTDADGNRVLFIEEVQSDWHQAGRKRGYKGNPNTEGWTATKGPGDPASGPVWEVRDATGRWILGVPQANVQTAEAAIQRAADSERGPDGSRVPDAPFKQTWSLLTMKRMIRYASEQGYDKIAWTTGEQQETRYPGTKHKWFYDRDLPNMVNKFVKRWGAKVGTTKIDVGEGRAEGAESDAVLESLQRLGPIDEEGFRAARPEMSEVHALPINDAMRDDVLFNGLPLFAVSDVNAFNNFDTTSETTKDWLLRRAQDKFRRFKTLQRAIEEQTGKPLPDRRNVYQAEMLMYGRTEEDLVKIEEDYIEPLVKELAKSGLKIEQLDEYLEARHAPERNAHIQSINPAFEQGGAGMTDAEAAAIMKQAEQDGTVGQLERLAQMVDAMNERKLEVWEEAGLETAEYIAMLRENYEHYVPLKGFRDEEGAFQQGAGRGRGFDISGKETKRALGRRSRAASPVINSILDLEATFVRARKNEVGKNLVNLARAHPNDNIWKVIKAPAIEMAKPRYDENRGEVVMAPDNLWWAKKEADDVLGVKIRGMQYYVHLKDPLLARAMKNLGEEKANGLVGLLGRLNRGLAMINTSLSPEFIVSNAARDIQTAMLNLLDEQDANLLKDHKKIAAQTMKDLPKALRGAYRNLRHKTANDEWTKWMEEYRHAGGKVGFFGLVTLEQKRAKLLRMVKEGEGGIKGNAYKYFREFGNLVMDINGAVENAARLSAYKNAREAGLSKAKAANLAKNLTVNFNKKGELGTISNALYLFYNAALQGSARLIQGVVRSRKLQITMAGIAVGAFALAEMNRMIAGDDDDGENFYDKIADWEKQRNFILMKPDGTYWKFPLPYGYNVPHVLGETINQMMHGKDVAQSAVHVIDTFLESFNPLGTEDSEQLGNRLLKMVSPTATDPWLSLALNENFYGAPIMPENFPFGRQKPDSHLYFSTVSPMAKGAAQGLNELTGGNPARPGWIDVSPESIEHIMDFFTGSAGRFVRQTVELPAKVADPEPMKVKEIPFLRRFAGEQSEWLTNSRYWEHKEEIDALYYEREYLKEARRPTAEFDREYGRLLGLRRAFQNAEKKLRRLRKRKRTVQADSTLDEKTRTTIINNVNKQIERHQKAVNRRYNEIVEEEG